MDKDERLEVIRVLSLIAKSREVTDNVDEKEVEKILYTLDMCKDMIEKIENDRDSIDERMYDISYNQVPLVVSKIAIDIIWELINRYTTFTLTERYHIAKKYVDFLNELVTVIHENRRQ